MIFGVDIYHGNSPTGSPFPLQKAAAEGVDFVIAKASQGYCPPGTASRPYNFKDEAFDRHAKAGRDAGLVVGAYHWLMRPSVLTGTGPEQAEFFVRSLGRGVDGTLDDGIAAADGLLLAVDVERTTFGTGPEEREIDGIPAWGVVRRFVERFHELLPGHPLLIYGNEGSGAAIMEHDVAALGDTLFWYACWNGYDGRIRDVDPVTITSWHPGIGGFAEATLLQFSSEADFAKRPRVDTNAFRGTREQLEALAHATVDQVPEPTRRERRQQYRRGYDALLDAVRESAQLVSVVMPAADAGSSDAYRSGVEAARQDLIERLDRRLLVEAADGP